MPYRNFFWLLWITKKLLLLLLLLPVRAVDHGDARAAPANGVLIDVVRTVGGQERVLLGVGQPLTARLWGNPILGKSWQLRDEVSRSGSGTTACAGLTSLVFQEDQAQEPRKRRGNYKKHTVVFCSKVDHCCEDTLWFDYVQSEAGSGPTIGAGGASSAALTSGEYGNGEDRGAAQVLPYGKNGFSENREIHFHPINTLVLAVVLRNQAARAPTMAIKVVGRQ
eukprot:g4088.t1